MLLVSISCDYKKCEKFLSKNGQYPENCVNEVRQKDRTFYIRLKNTQL
jgi:hypothetical protein